MGAVVGAVVAYFLSVFHLPVIALALAVVSSLPGIWQFYQYFRNSANSAHPASTVSAFGIVYTALHLTWHQTIQATEGVPAPSLTDYWWPPINTQPYASLCFAIPSIGAVWSAIVCGRGIEAMRRGEDPLNPMLRAGVDAANALGNELQALPRLLPHRWRRINSAADVEDGSRRGQDEEKAHYFCQGACAR